jgi:hypothetical protein
VRVVPAAKRIFALFRTESTSNWPQRPMPTMAAFNMLMVFPEE